MRLSPGWDLLQMMTGRVYGVNTKCWRSVIHSFGTLPHGTSASCAVRVQDGI